jgi:hypothetical protein
VEQPDEVSALGGLILVVSRDIPQVERPKGPVQARIETLGQRANEGALSAAERTEYEALLRVRLPLRGDAAIQSENHSEGDSIVDFQGAGAPATREGILAVLDSLNVKLPQLLAIVTVETSGCGCFADRRRPFFLNDTSSPSKLVANSTPHIPISAIGLRAAMLMAPANTTVWPKQCNSTVRLRSRAHRGASAK